MVIPRPNLKGLEVDLAGAAAVLVAAIAGYALFLQGPLHDAMGGSRLEEQQSAAASAIATLQADYKSRLGRVEAARARLATQSGWLGDADAPSEVLARINEFARQCEVRIGRWQPQAVQVCAEYREQAFVIDGEAAWPALLQWLALVEEGVPLLDLTHFTVSAPVSPGQGNCTFSCTLKLYRGKDKPMVQVVAVQP